MREIIEALQALKGKDVDIYTAHALFGKQHLQMKLEPETSMGVGFRCKEQAIYIKYDDIVNYQIDDKGIIINGNLMRIIITKID